MKAVRVFRAYTFDEAVAVELLVKFDHAIGHHVKFIGIGRCATDTKRDEQFFAAIFSGKVIPHILRR